MSSDDEIIQNMSDEDFSKKIIGNPEIFDLIKRDITPLIDSGIRLRMNSLKEEEFLGGYGSIAGGEDLMMGNELVDPSNRAVNQIFNREPKVYAPDEYYSPVRPNRFGSKLGVANNIDYTNDSIYGLYTGATTTDEKIYEELK